MASEKRYFWLKLPEGFFRQKEIKRLRKIAGGDTYTIIYLKMLLRSLSNNGVLFFDGVENDFVSELALDIDEDEENVAVTVQFLMKQGILEEINEDEYLLKTCADMVGSEAANAERMRQHRKKIKTSQCDGAASLGDSTVTNCDRCVITSDTEIEKEIEKETETEKEIEKENRINYQQIVDMYNETCISLPKVKSLSDARKKAIKARSKKYSLADIQQAFINAEESDFLKGNNNRNWTADFDWLMKDSNIAKVLDGNYKNRGNNPQHQQNSVSNYIDMWRDA